MCVTAWSSIFQAEIYDADEHRDPEKAQEDMLKGQDGVFKEKVAALHKRITSLKKEHIELKKEDSETKLKLRNLNTVIANFADQVEKLTCERYDLKQEVERRKVSEHQKTTKNVKMKAQVKIIV